MQRTLGMIWAVVACAFVAVVAQGCSRSDLAYDLGTIDGGDDGPLAPDGYLQPDSPLPAKCPNGTCDPGETCQNCAADCGECPSCGNKTCEPNLGENCSSCPQDCGDCPTCGDGFCNGNETCASCAPDCGMCPGCGDGKCSSTETCYSCPQDCGKCAGCGDGLCDPNETCSSCPMDCGPCSVCGNNKCEAPYETCVNCPGDCGQCPVKSCLQELTCAVNCIGGLGGGGFRDGGIPNINLTCVADCAAEGCASAQYFVNQALNCFIQALVTGQCTSISLNCLMNACPGEIAACLADHC